MGVYWNNNGKNGNSTIDIEDSFIISYVKKWIYSKGDTLMNADVEFLNYVYQNSQMGIDTLEQLLEITEDEKLQTCLEKQIEGYRKFHNEARDMTKKVLAPLKKSAPTLWLTSRPWPMTPPPTSPKC